MSADLGAMLQETAAGAALLRPWWLIALPLVLALALLVRRPGDLGDWRRAVDPALLALMAARGAVLPPAGSAGRLSPALAAAALVAAALAGPALERTNREAFRNLDGLVIAVDLSRSMTATGALADAGVGALQLIEAAADRQAALVFFAGDAYPATPFTADPAALRPLLVTTPADLVPEAGSDPGRALAAVRALFEASAMIGGDAVLATDGGGIDEAALAEARRLAAAGKRLHVLFSPGTPLTDRPPPDRAAALALAVAGDGVFADVANPQPIVAALTTGTAARLGASGYGALFLQDYGRLLLGLAALPMLLMFPEARLMGRRPIVLVTLLAAAALAAIAARDPLAGLMVRVGLAGPAALVAADPALRGIASYEAGDFAGAAEAFRGSTRPEAAYNLGNALARAGRPAEAAKAYRVALLRDPDDRDAAGNLALVEALIAAAATEREDSDRIEGRGATAAREMDSRDTAGSDEQADVRSTSGDGLAGMREAGGSAAAAGSSRVDRRGDGGNDSSEDGEGSSKGAAADTAGRSGRSGGLTTVATSDDAPPQARTETEAGETGQATRQWLAAIPDDPVLFVRLRVLAERQKRLQDGTALRVGGTAW